jgi:hypothetical protein
MPTDIQISKRFEENGLKYTKFPLQNKAFLLIGERGGRVFGPFIHPGEESIYWVNRAFEHPISFKQALNSGFWNQGGERVWVAPEIQYFVHDRGDFWGTNHLPAQLDPGNYVLTCEHRHEVMLRNEFTLEAYNTAEGSKSLQLEIRIQSVENPLRYLPETNFPLSDLIYAGYQQIVRLKEINNTPIESESWNLVQLNPGGYVFIPASPRVQYYDYFEPVDNVHQHIHSDHVRLHITGQRRYKTGYTAAHITGRSAYYNFRSDGQAYLLVRHFFNNPSAPYLEEPPQLPGVKGKSLHVYNDGGQFGGFGELEVNGQAIGGATGRSESTDQFVMWLFVGESKYLQEIARHLLGINVDFSTLNN